MKDVEYWVWLQQFVGAGARLDETLSYFGTPRNAYEAGVDEWRVSGLFDELRMKRMASVSPSECSLIVERCVKNGWQIYTLEDSRYPKLLKTITNPPAVLYVDGELSFLDNRLVIAVVGTRNPSRYGIESAKKIVKGLTSAGAAIVSGGALGIDSIAHNTCIDNSQKTVLVMGCGLGASYLQQNSETRERVAQNGALVTEYPPMSPPNSSSFVLRNRIISGISNGVVVVEAGEKSGSLNTAAHAEKQGRRVFALPGDFSSNSFNGANRLISAGAKAIFSIDDILRVFDMEQQLHSALSSESSAEPFEGHNEFPLGKKNEKQTRRRSSKKQQPERSAEHMTNAEVKPSPAGHAEITLDNLSQTSIIVYKLLETAPEPCNVDFIVSLSSLYPHEVLCALTELEISGLVAVNAGGFYSTKIT